MKIPKEDTASQNFRLRPRLERSLYGTRSSSGPSMCVGRHMNLGTKRPKGHWESFEIQSNGVELVLHVDDFWVVGEEHHTEGVRSLRAEGVHHRR